MENDIKNVETEEEKGFFGKVFEDEKVQKTAHDAAVAITILVITTVSSGLAVVAKEVKVKWKKRSERLGILSKYEFVIDAELTRGIFQKYKNSEVPLKLSLKNLNASEAHSLIASINTIKFNCRMSKRETARWNAVIEYINEQVKNKEK